MYYNALHKKYDTLGLPNVCCVSLTILEVIGYRAVLLICFWISWDTLRLLGAIEIHCNRAVYVSLNTNANPNPNPNPKLSPSPNRPQ